MALVGTTGKSITFNLTTPDGRTDLFPRAEIYHPSTGFIIGIPMTHQAKGIFRATHTCGAPETYVVFYGVYTDAGFTTPFLGYSNVSDDLIVEEIDLLDVRQSIGRLANTR